MTRQIKFKVWDVLGKRMFSFEEAVSTGVDISTPDGRNYQMPLFSVAFVDNKHKLIAIQYTNANDKNNKEIYEGDIVNYRGRIGKVEYFAAMYICSWNDQTEDELSHMIIGDIEVIGNVFENPELLNSIPPVVEEDEEEENEDLSSCENCGERGWDGRICHICGAKHI